MTETTETHDQQTADEHRPAGSTASSLTEEQRKEIKRLIRDVLFEMEEM